MSDRDLTLKILLLGDVYSGKDELVRKYASRCYPEDTKLSLGVDFFLKTIHFKDKKIIMQLWDAESEDIQAFRLSSYCRGSNGAIIMYDITNFSTIKHVPEWVQLIRKNAGDIPILLVGNIFNLEKSLEVSGEEGIKLAKKNNITGFIEISTKTGENIEEMFESFAEILIYHYCE
ncbi:MAG: Rab family GTPase [Candidatus Hermodarchaeota archaeon]